MKAFQRNTSFPAGVAIVPVFEGSRVFLVEIQSLTVPAKANTTRVYSDKVDFARVSRVAAVLEKSLGLKFSDQDIYINVAGGIKLTERLITIGTVNKLAYEFARNIYNEYIPIVEVQNNIIKSEMLSQAIEDMKQNLQELEEI